MEKHCRHGDVLLTRVETMPSSKEEKHTGEYILAYGEVTGHCHRLRVKNPKNLTVTKDKTGNLYLALTEVGTLTHEEHKKIEILPGVYRMTFEREYDYAMESMRKVID